MLFIMAMIIYCLQIPLSEEETIPVRGGDNMDSILTSIKKLLGITEEYEHFDTDIIIHINTVFSTLTQLGVGPKKGFSITDKSSVWNDFIPKSSNTLECIKTYVYLKVKLVFDPPLNSAVIESINRQISELEWRINSEVDYK